MKNVRCLIGKLTLAILSLTAAYGADEVYTASGRVYYEVFQPKPKTMVREFSISVSNCLWAISTSFPGASNGMHFKEIYDGETVRSVGVFGEGAPGNNGSAALIEANQYPNPNQGTFGSFIWLALGSSCFFERANSSMLPPIFFVDEGLWKSNTHFRGAFELSPTLRGLPKKLSYVPPHSSIGINNHPSNVVLGRFEVTEVESLVGRQWPKQFRYTHFSERGGIKRYQFRAEVLYITNTIDHGIFDPVLSGTVIVEDRRLQSGSDQGPLQYEIRNRAIPATNDPLIAFELDRQRFFRHTEIPYRSNRWRRWLPYLGFALLTLVFLRIYKRVSPAKSPE
jgi:hypothetical protein